MCLALKYFRENMRIRAHETGTLYEGHAQRGPAQLDLTATSESIEISRSLCGWMSSMLTGFKICGGENAANQGQ
ncbi:MAG: hypothetical protein RQ885_09910 [Desulfurococcales archaeon]|nr:hypothetical protein [Desulfurococcales archaeon]